MITLSERNNDTTPPTVTPTGVENINQKYRVQQNLRNVTSAQIGACHLVTDHQTHTDFWQVENDEGLFDEEANLIEYQVRFSTNGYSCTCDQFDPINLCWHVFASESAAIEMTQSTEEEDDVYSLTRLNDYQVLATNAPSEAVKHAALRTVAKIVAQRNDVALNETIGMWQVVEHRQSDIQSA